MDRHHSRSFRPQRDYQPPNDVECAAPPSRPVRRNEFRHHLQLPQFVRLERVPVSSLGDANFLTALGEFVHPQSTSLSWDSFISTIEENRIRMAQQDADNISPVIAHWDELYRKQNFDELFDDIFSVKERFPDLFQTTSSEKEQRAFESSVSSQEDYEVRATGLVETPQEGAAPNFPHLGSEPPPVEALPNTSLSFIRARPDAALPSGWRVFPAIASAWSRPHPPERNAFCTATAILASHPFDPSALVTVPTQAPWVHVPAPPTHLQALTPIQAPPTHAPPVPVQAPPAPPLVPIQAPSAPVQAPSAPVQAPSAPVQAPSAPRPAPSAPVQAPSAPAQAPSAPVQAPSAPVQAPSAPPAPPLVPVQAPPAPVQAPPTPSLAPVQAPPAPVQAPPAPVQAPPAPVQAPPAPVQAPPAPVQAPPAPVQVPPAPVQAPPPHVPTASIPEFIDPSAGSVDAPHGSAASVPVQAPAPFSASSDQPPDILAPSCDESHKTGGPPGNLSVCGCAAPAGLPVSEGFSQPVASVGADSVANSGLSCSSDPNPNLEYQQARERLRQFYRDVHQFLTRVHTAHEDAIARLDPHQPHQQETTVESVFDALGKSVAYTCEVLDSILRSRTFTEGALVPPLHPVEYDDKGEHIRSLRGHLEETVRPRARCEASKYLSLGAPFSGWLISLPPPANLIRPRPEGIPLEPAPVPQDLPAIDPPMEPEAPFQSVDPPTPLALVRQDVEARIRLLGVGPEEQGFLDALDQTIQLLHSGGPILAAEEPHFVETVQRLLGGMAESALDVFKALPSATQIREHLEQANKSYQSLKALCEKQQNPVPLLLGPPRETPGSPQQRRPPTFHAAATAAVFSNSLSMAASTDCNYNKDWEDLKGAFGQALQDLRAVFAELVRVHYFAKGSQLNALEPLRAMPTPLGESALEEIRAHLPDQINDLQQPYKAAIDKLQSHYQTAFNTRERDRECRRKTDADYQQSFEGYQTYLAKNTAEIQAVDAEIQELYMRRAQLITERTHQRDMAAQAFAQYLQGLAVSDINDAHLSLYIDRLQRTLCRYETASRAVEAVEKGIAGGLRLVQDQADRQDEQLGGDLLDIRRLLLEVTTDFVRSINDRWSTRLRIREKTTTKKVGFERELVEAHETRDQDTINMIRAQFPNVIKQLEALEKEIDSLRATKADLAQLLRETTGDELPRMLMEDPAPIPLHNPMASSMRQQPLPPTLPRVRILAPPDPQRSRENYLNRSIDTTAVQSTAADQEPPWKRALPGGGTSCHEQFTPCGPARATRKNGVYVTCDVRHPAAPVLEMNEAWPVEGCSPWRCYLAQSDAGLTTHIYQQAGSPERRQQVLARCRVLMSLRTAVSLLGVRDAWEEPGTGDVCFASPPLRITRLSEWLLYWDSIAVQPCEEAVASVVRQITSAGGKARVFVLTLWSAGCVSMAGLAALHGARMRHTSLTPTNIHLREWKVTILNAIQCGVFQGGIPDAAPAPRALPPKLAEQWGVLVASPDSLRRVEWAQLDTWCIGVVTLQLLLGITDDQLQEACGGAHPRPVLASVAAVMGPILSVSDLAPAMVQSGYHTTADGILALFGERRPELSEVAASFIEDALLHRHPVSDLIQHPFLLAQPASVELCPITGEPLTATNRSPLDRRFTATAMERHVAVWGTHPFTGRSIDTANPLEAADDTDLCGPAPMAAGDEPPQLTSVTTTDPASAPGLSRSPTMTTSDTFSLTEPTHFEASETEFASRHESGHLFPYRDPHPAGESHASAPPALSPISASSTDEMAASPQPAVATACLSPVALESTASAPAPPAPIPMPLPLLPNTALPEDGLGATPLPPPFPSAMLPVPEGCSAPLAPSISLPTPAYLPDPSPLAASASLPPPTSSASMGREEPARNVAAAEAQPAFVSAGFLAVMPSAAPAAQDQSQAPAPAPAPDQIPAPDQAPAAPAPDQDQPAAPSPLSAGSSVVIPERLSPEEELQAAMQGGARQQ
ncbi:hypothetical protein PAPYR_921 [Paratrimastix pyriformis]|uniref:Uncharacterized protein n=1 Tax=Paratrimastix pyriformis TaxID=342808 RepID=A0ABQ8UT47_9EUKA|nr:hypothetical protein PAPYR_921 [Paratrimastix pyriformis]